MQAFYAQPVCGMMYLRDKLQPILGVQDVCVWERKIKAYEVSKNNFDELLQKTTNTLLIKGYKNPQHIFSEKSAVVYGYCKEDKNDKSGDVYLIQIRGCPSKEELILHTRNIMNQISYRKDSDPMWSPPERDILFVFCFDFVQDATAEWVVRNWNPKTSRAYDAVGMINPHPFFIDFSRKIAFTLNEKDKEHSEKLSGRYQKQLEMFLLLIS